MKRLQSCCCCVSTRNGSIITAVLGILMSIATIICIWVAPRGTLRFSTLIPGIDHDNIPSIIVTINLCFTILICSLLIVAILKRRSWLMLPFVVLGLVLAVGLLISLLHTCITSYLDDTRDNTIIATAMLIFGLIFLILYLYFWAVVCSHYLEIKEEEQRGRYRKAPYRR